MQKSALHQIRSLNHPATIVYFEQQRRFPERPELVDAVVAKYMLRH